MNFKEGVKELTSGLKDDAFGYLTSLINTRLLLTSSALLVFGGLNAYLLAGEDILTFQEESGQTVREEDPLLGLRYTSGERRKNFEAYGMPNALCDEAMAAVEKLESQNIGKILEARYEEAGDPQALADALCGDGANMRPRYAALEFFVQEDGGSRSVIDLRRTTSLDRQEWAIDGPIVGVYREVELAEDYKSDATIMAVAALLLGTEDQVFEQVSPWGRGLLAEWSWEEVAERYPGVQSQVVDYFAVMHLATEKAQEEGSICD